MTNRAKRDVWGNEIGDFMDPYHPWSHYLDQEASEEEHKKDAKRGKKYDSIVGGEPVGGIPRGRF